jgi:UDP-2,4-diacetamido-2,4,6-trideoxy-beta-L-altropyranose hydrolase
MNIAIRVDASQQIGTGHVMRCLTLADGLAKHGAYIRFIARHMPKYLQDMITSKGYEFKQLNRLSTSNLLDELKHAEWLGVSQAKDAEESITELTDKNWNWLIVDHYALDFRWEAKLRNTTQKLMVIDDLADRNHDCDILLDQNFYADMDSRYTDKVPFNCQLILGPKYALIRDGFREARKTLQVRSSEVKRVLVFFGGMDSQNYTGKAIEALSELTEYRFDVDVVIGDQHPNKGEIIAMCAAYGYLCHVQTNSMAELMANADLALGAGGTAVWERCCLGLPALSISVASNQHRQIEDAAKEGLLYALSTKGDLLELLKRHLKVLFENAYLLKLISNTAMRAVDGQGTLHVIKKFGYPKMTQANPNNISVRLAVADDAVLVWPWRNNESTRRYFFDSSPVSLNSHTEWWKQSLSNVSRVLLLGKLNENEIGVIRYDFDELQNAKVSIYLDPELTGLGFGEHLLCAGQDWILKNHPEVKAITAEVMVKNIASLKVFQAAGFQEQHILMSRKSC